MRGTFFECPNCEAWFYPNRIRLHTLGLILPARRTVNTVLVHDVVHVHLDGFSVSPACLCVVTDEGLPLSGIYSVDVKQCPGAVGRFLSRADTLSSSVHITQESWIAVLPSLPSGRS